MTNATTKGSSVRDDPDEMLALIKAGAVAAALAILAMGGAAGLGGDVATIALVSCVALAGVAIGHLLGRRDGGAARATRILMLRVADELAQYRAFTHLLRDQGARIIESTSGAATMIVDGLDEMEAIASRMRLLVDHVASNDLIELRSMVEAVGAPIIGMLGHLQFQDVIQQQIVFLSRLSLVLDDHMTQLSRQLGDRRALDRVARFKDMFDEALASCVMDSQRNDHHAASGLATREAPTPRLEMF
jgi:hypothetical protein